jgi:hypothetical protein
VAHDLAAISLHAVGGVRNEGSGAGTGDARIDDGGWTIVKDKKLLVMVCLLAAATSHRAADPAVEEKVKSIRAKYAEIEKELRDCRQVSAAGN